MKKYLIASLAAFISGGAAIALAASDAESVVQERPAIVMEQAVALAKHYGQGAVTKVEFEQKGERNLYEARVAREGGEIRRLYIDANTAEVVENSGTRF